MLKFDDPVVIDNLYAISRKLTNAVEEALKNEHHNELARLTGIQQGLILAIDIAREQSVRLPQAHDTPFLPAVVATLHEDG
ncbi:hypothetical protein A6U97_13380 [Agrobacterium tumefaciens]|uniref:hypothetical protein n=1 Tax=Agrobacterium tumefaciens TaxID=358 RepID=UPI00080FEFC4|nr:hypothetical protein A6U97_13380 [Agrobacterium tumefaciens]